MSCPAPYPADTKAKGWRFELDHEQIRQSDTWTLATPDQRPWLLMLWMTAWEQIPCGSLPNDDTLIAARIGMQAKQFAKCRDLLLRGWWLADDGRLYHDTIISKVTSMLGKKEKDRRRKGEWRSKQSPQISNGCDFVPQESHGTDGGQTEESYRKDDTKHQAPSTKHQLNTLVDSKPSTRPVDRKPKFSADDLSTAEYLFSGVKRLNPNARQPNLESWASSIRLMRERDLRADEQIRSLFDWANAHHFWAANILSPDTLREKFDRLVIQRQQESNHAANQPIPFRNAALAGRPPIANLDGTDWGDDLDAALNIG